MVPTVMTFRSLRVCNEFSHDYQSYPIVWSLELVEWRSLAGISEITRCNLVAERVACKQYQEVGWNPVRANEIRNSNILFTTSRLDLVKTETVFRSTLLLFVSAGLMKFSWSKWISLTNLSTDLSIKYLRNDEQWNFCTHFFNSTKLSIFCFN